MSSQSPITVSIPDLFTEFNASDALSTTSLPSVNATTKFNANALWPLEVQIAVPIASVLVFFLGQLALYVIDDPGLRREKARKAALLLDTESACYSDDTEGDENKKKKKKKHGSRVVSDAEQPKSGTLSKRVDAPTQAEPLLHKSEVTKVDAETSILNPNHGDSKVIAVIAKDLNKQGLLDPHNLSDKSTGGSHEIAIQCTLIGGAECNVVPPADKLRRVVTDLQLEKPVTQANQTQVLLSAYLLKRPVATGSQQRVGITDSKRRFRAQSACEGESSEASTYHTWHIGDLPSKRRKGASSHKASADTKMGQNDASSKICRIESGTKLGDVDSATKLGSGGQPESANVKAKDPKGSVKKVDSRSSTAEKHVTLKVNGEESEPSKQQQLKFTVGDTADELAHEAVSNLSYVTVRGLNDVRRYQGASKPVANGQEMLDRNRNGSTQQRTESLSESGNI